MPILVLISINQFTASEEYKFHNNLSLINKTSTECLYGEHIKGQKMSWCLPLANHLESI